MPFAITAHELLHDGCPIRLRGASLGGWLLVESYMCGIPGVEQHMREAFADVLGAARAARFWEIYQDTYYREEDISWLHSQGFNLLRLPFNHRLFQDDPALGRSPARGFALFDRVFTWAKRHGMYVLLDLHAAPGGQADDWNADGISGEKRFFTDSRCQDQTVALWTELAMRYRHHPNLFGYDPLCEPVWHDRAALNAFYARVQRAIRSVDPTGIITLEPNLWSREASTLDLALFEDPHTIVHGHWYPGAQELERELPDAELWGLMSACLGTDRIRRPALMGEFGLMWAQWDQPRHHALITRMVRLMEAHQVPWSVWALKDVGMIGLTSPRADSPWRMFLKRPAIRDLQAELNRLAAVDFSGSAHGGGELQVRARRLFPGEDHDRLARLVRDAQRSLEHLGARHLARELARLDDAEFEACARGFDHAVCEPHQALVDALRAGFAVGAGRPLRSAAAQ